MKLRHEDSNWKPREVESWRLAAVLRATSENPRGPQWDELVSQCRLFTSGGGKREEGAAWSFDAPAARVAAEVVRGMGRNGEGSGFFDRAARYWESQAAGPEATESYLQLMEAALYRWSRWMQPDSALLRMWENLVRAGAGRQRLFLAATTLLGDVEAITAGGLPTGRSGGSSPLLSLPEALAARDRIARDTLELSPPSALAALCELVLAQSAAVQGRFREAEAHARQAARIPSDESEVHRQAERLLERLISPVLDITAPPLYRPGSRHPLQLHWRNLRGWKLNVRRLDPVDDLLPVKQWEDVDGRPKAGRPSSDGFLASFYTRDGSEEEAVFQSGRNDEVEMAARRPLSPGEHALEPHVARDTTLVLDALPEGLYLARVEGETFDGVQAPVATQLLQVTRLGLKITPVGEGVCELWLTRADTGRSVSGVELLVRRRWKSTGQKQWSSIEQRVRLDKSGRGRFGKKGKPAHREQIFVAGQWRGKPVVLSGDLYARSFQPREQFRWRGFVLSDRPLYRPGETVHLQAFVRRADLIERVIEIPKPRPVEIVVRDPSGSEVLREQRGLDKNGSAETQFALSGRPALGSYSVQIRYGSQTLVRGEFQVDEYRLPEFLVNAEIVAGTKYVLGDTLKVVLSAKYLFGGPVEGEAEVVVRRRRFGYIWRPEPFAGLRGTESARPWPNFGGEEVLRTQLPLDAEGEAVVRIPTFDLPEDPQARFEYTVEARVRDASRREESGAAVVRVGAEEVVASLVPKQYVVSPGDSVFVRLHVEDLMQRAVSLRGRWSLVRLAEEGEEGEEALGMPKRVETSPGGDALLPFQLHSAGRYRVQFTARDGHDRPVKAQTVIWCVAGGKRLVVYGTKGLQLIASEDAYLFETAEILVVSERRDVDVYLTRNFAGRVKSEVLRLKGNAALVRIPLDRFHRPFFFLDASAAWDFRFHRTGVKVTALAKDRLMRLEAEFDSGDHLPGELAKLHLRATSAEGLPLQVPVTVAIVDDAILQLRPRVEPDFSALLQDFPVLRLPPGEDTNRRLGVYYDWDLMHQKLLEASPGLVSADGGLRMKGNAVSSAPMEELAGGSGAAMDAAQAVTAARSAAIPGTVAGVGSAVAVRRDFRPTALWRTAVITSTDGRAEVECKLPESLTRWTAWAVSLSEDCRAGSAHVQTRTHKPLMVRLNHPRTFREGDRFRFSATVHNEEPNSVHVQLKLHAEGLQLDDDRAELDVPARGQAEAEWLARVPRHAAGQAVSRDEKTGRIVVEPKSVEASIEAVAEGGSDAFARKVEIYPWGTPLHLVTATRLRDDSTAELKLSLPSARRDDLSRVFLQISPSVLSACLDALPYLSEFPYGCTEQTLSRFVPAVAVRQVAGELGVSSSRIDPRLDEKVGEGLRRIARMQRPDGGWGWWAQDESRPDLTAYALVALHRAAQAGVKVDPVISRRGRERLRALLPRLERNDDDMAYALYALALTGQPEDGVMARFSSALVRHRDRLRDYARALAASYLHLVGRDDEGRSMLVRLEESAQVDREYGTVHWGRRKGSWWRGDGAVETTAFALQAFLDLAPGREEAEGAARWLVANREGRRWDSTRATAHAIYALSAYARHRGEINPDFDLSARVGGEEILRIHLDRSNLLDGGGQWPVDVARLAAAGGQVDLRLDGRGTAYASLSLDTWTSGPDPAPTENWISIERRYFRLRPVRTLGGGILSVEEELAPGDSVASGDRIRVRLRLHAHRSIDYLVVEDPRPAGCEPVERLSGWVARTGWSGRRELRDEATVFFISRLEEGVHRFDEELRAESPGVFRIPPARVEGMYLPAVNGTSRAFSVRLRSTGP